MKKNIITILTVIAFIAAPVLAATGVWTAVGSSGGGGSCYLVNFTTNSYGVHQLIGTGVVSGTTFSGFLKASSNAQNSGSTYVTTCSSAVQDCAWGYAAGTYNAFYNPSSLAYTVSVVNLTINSAQPIACW